MIKQITVAICLIMSWVTNPIQAETVKISDDLTIHYETAGSGPIVILFVPGWAMSTKVFEHQLSASKDSTDYTFVTYDPRGQGQSSKTPDGHFYQQHGRDLNDLINALNLNNIVLAGWSFGGLEVLSYINQFGTDRLKGVGLIDAAPKSRGADNTKEWVWYRYDDSDGFEGFFYQWDHCCTGMIYYRVSQSGCSPINQKQISPGRHRLQKKQTLQQWLC